MTRRAFLPAAGAAAVTGGIGMAADPASRAILEISYYKLRNSPDGQRQRLSAFLEKTAVPALKKAGAGPVGVFANSISPDGPFLMMLAEFPSLAAYEQIRAKMSADPEFSKALEAFDRQPGLSYERVERTLLRGFPGMPRIEVPGGDAKRPSRIFEVRRYESNNHTTLATKIRMFDSGETAIFRRLGMVPVFFGETIAGTHMPNLVYMLGYDDLAARDKAWRAFGGDPEWKKMRDTPGWSDAEIVSNITNFLVTPLPFSDIR